MGVGGGGAAGETACAGDKLIAMLKQRLEQEQVRGGVAGCGGGEEEVWRGVGEEVRRREESKVHSSLRAVGLPPGFRGN